MEPEVNALPQGDTAAAGEPADTAAAPAPEQEPQQEGQETKAEGEGAEKEPPKKEKSPEQREIERLRRRVDNLTRQKYELRATVPQQPQQEQKTQAGDDEPVTLSRAELQKLIAEQAKELAPAMTEQRAEAERRQGVVKALAKQWGQDEFDAKAADLDDVFGGLADASGRPRPATDAIFDADNPQSVIEYLTDPDNADEAERIARLPAVRAGREIARIEAKLEAAKKEAKPKPSNAPRPIEAVKGGGVPNGMPDPSNTKAYIAWANAQERASR